MFSGANFVSWQLIMWFKLGGGYNYDSTSMRLQFDRTTTSQRPTLQP